MRVFVAIGSLALAGWATLHGPARVSHRPVSSLIEKPYVQLGDSPLPGKTESLEILWHAADTNAAWELEYRLNPSDKWQDALAPTFTRVAVKDIDPFRVYKSKITGLKPGQTFYYRLLDGADEVFVSQAVARKSAAQPYRFVVFGDCSQNTKGQKEVAYQTYRAKPDFVLITGDIVYGAGRVSEYRSKYFPIYNADDANPEVGAPLTRSTLFIGAPGNHDILNRDLDKSPDLLAYFYYWSLPLNGLGAGIGDPSTPTLTGAEERQRAILNAAGKNYPGMANYSFVYGNAHYTILDSNPYVDWLLPRNLDWVKKQLENGKKYAWNFVAFHHPGFNSSKSHFDDQRMRALSETFEQGGVDVVFNGHVHNYQRSYPLTFVPKKDAQGKPMFDKTRVDGVWTLDKDYDGINRTKPKGVLYIVTGGGGAGLYNPEQEKMPETWQGFTHKFISSVHSFTVVDVKGKTLAIKQIDAQGKELDRFVVTK